MELVRLRRSPVWMDNKFLFPHRKSADRTVGVGRKVAVWGDNLRYGCMGRSYWTMGVRGENGEKADGGRGVVTGWLG